MPRSTLVIFVILVAAAFGWMALSDGSQASEPLLQGDANCDGVVDELDALALLTAEAGLGETQCMAEAGDADCDGEPGADDAMPVLEYVAGLSDESASGCTPIGEALPEVTPPPTGTSAPPTPTESTGATETVTSTAIGTQTPTPDGTVTPTIRPTGTGNETLTLTPTPTITPTPTPTLSPSPTLTPTPTPTPGPVCPAFAPGPPGGGPFPLPSNYQLAPLVTPVGSQVPPAPTPPYSKLTDVEMVPGTDGEAFLTNQEGLIWRVCLTAPVAYPNVGSVPATVTSDEGLLGFTFDPNDPGVVYLNYTVGASGAYYRPGSPTPANPKRSRISRFEIENGQLVPGSERIIMEILRPHYWHNVSDLVFEGGHLYIGSGDGGDKWHANGQTTDDLLGVVLRIDPGANGGYTIPSGNPFVNNSAVRDEIWSYGLRHPWRFTFDNGTMWLTDVGQTAWEEINQGEAGANYGWALMEGPDCTNITPTPGASPTRSPYPTDPVTPTDGPSPTRSPYPSATPCPTAGLATPRFSYPHNSSGGCSIIGGYVYRGTEMPELDGWYIYGDVCVGKVWAFDVYAPKPPIGQPTETPVMLVDTAYSITDFALTPDGEILILDYGGYQSGQGSKPGVYKLERLP